MAHKTHTRKVTTLHVGEFEAYESVSICKFCKRTHASEQLRTLVAPSCNFGYDVVVYVGKALFLRHRNAQETVLELAEKNVAISQSEIHVLGRKFITLLAMAHRQCAERIKKAMSINGGYILHLDGTREGKGPVLMTGLDSIMDIVLGNIKLTSEKADELIPFLEKMDKLFGAPIACVHDMGAGIIKAVEKVFEGIPDFICHFHFLRDLGKDLFGDEYTIIRKRLRKHAVTGKIRSRARVFKGTIDQHPQLINLLQSAMKKDKLPNSDLQHFPVLSAYTLIQWALDAMNQGDGYGFPFDRPFLDLAKRLIATAKHIEHLAKIELRRNWKDNKPYYKTLRDLSKCRDDKILQHAITDIERKIELFDKLRIAMRIAPVKGDRGLNYEPSDEPMKTIEKRVQQFYEELCAKQDYTTNAQYKAMAVQMKKYWKKLFADPIEVDTPGGKVQIQPQRTNNIMERFFRDYKRGQRRKTGNRCINRTMQTMLADTPLVKNLENSEYTEILHDGKKNLEEVFAQIDAAKLRQELAKAQQHPEKVPTVIKRLVQKAIYPQKLKQLVHATAIK